MNINPDQFDALVDFALECIENTQAGNVKSKDDNDDAEKGPENVGDFIKRLRGPKLSEVDKSNREYKREKIDLSLIDVDPTATDLVKRIKSIRSKPENEQPKAITCLFHGAPGTGKSTLARAIGKQLRMKVHIHSYAAIQSKYVGEGEKKLRSIFKKAQRDGAILILDECDALMLNREAADKEWQRSMTNQFLTELDEFKGIFIATTNYRDKLDSACLRRLFLKLEFKWMQDKTKLKAFNLFFGTRLRKMPAGLKDIKFLTIGDFKAVKERALYEPETPKTADYVRLLGEEVEYKSKTMKEVMDAEREPIGFNR